MPARHFRIVTALLAVVAAIWPGPALPAASVSWEQLKAPHGEIADNVEISGFLLPVDYEGDKVYQFMLLPWAGACSHTPPPPPDQIVLVTPEVPIEIERTYEPVTVSGHLRRNRDISQFFILDGTAWVESGYRIRSAQVRAANIPASSPPVGVTPWKFLNR